LKKVYTLATCSTSKRILSELGLAAKGYSIQDIKTEPVSADQLAAMKQLAGSYEALFSRLARKYKEQGLKDKPLTEEDYKNLILQEYTFLKRPVIISGKQIFIGNARKNVEAAAATL
jgi:arsenate reductase